jgi:hypothetical protein
MTRGRLRDKIRALGLSIDRQIKVENLEPDNEGAEEAV